MLAPLSALAVGLLLWNRRFRDHWKELLVPIAALGVAIVAFGLVALGQRGQLHWVALGGLHQVFDDLLGPASGPPRWYTVLLVLPAAVSIAVCLLARRRGTFDLDRDEVGPLAIALAWAICPAVVLVVASLVVPVFVERYVTVSAPGLALAIALLVGWAIERSALRWARVWRIASALVGAAIVTLTIAKCALPNAQLVSQDLRGAARYLAANVGPDGQAVILDHSLAEADDYYWSDGHETVMVWPQLARQPYIEGLDVRQDATTFASAPSNIWLLNDGSVVDTSEFIGKLQRAGYARVGVAAFTGVEVVHLRRSEH